MKGFLNILALPAIILPALAAPTLSPVERDLAIMKNLHAEVSPVTTELTEGLKLVKAGSPSAPSFASLESEWKTILAALASSSKQLKAVGDGDSALLKSRQSNPLAELTDELLAVVTQITQTVEKFEAAGEALPDFLNDTVLQLIGALTTLGSSASATDPSAPTEVAGVLEKILGV